MGTPCALFFLALLSRSSQLDRIAIFRVNVNANNFAVKSKIAHVAMHPMYLPWP